MYMLASMSILAADENFLRAVCMLSLLSSRIRYCHEHDSRIRDESY